MKTLSQARHYIQTHTGVGVDFDGSFGYQCADLAVDYMYYITDGQVRLWGNAKDAIKNDMKGLATVYRNTRDFKPQLGDISVYTEGAYSEYGHIQIVISGNLNYYLCLEQNWNGLGGSYQELATQRVHYYDGVTHFIRPHFRKESKLKNVYKWNGKFTSFKTNKRPIRVRLEPSLKGEIVDKNSWIYPNQYVKFDRIYKKDGFWWLGFYYQQKGASKNRFYMSIGKIEDKQEKILNEKHLWGKLEVEKHGK